MKGIQLPQYLYRGQDYEMQSRSFRQGAGAIPFDNLLQAHFQRQRMPNPEKKTGEIHNNNTYVDLSALYEKHGADVAKAEKAKMVEIVPTTTTQSTKEPCEVRTEETNEFVVQPSTSASTHVVDELRKVLEGRKKIPESVTSRDHSEEEMEVASSFSAQETMDPNQSVIERRKQRRRERNRLAAQRCRLKKRQEAISVTQEVSVLENANRDLKIKIHRLQTERDTLHSLIRKHLPKCISHSDVETDETNRGAGDMVKAEQTKPAAAISKIITPATWTISNPTYHRASESDAMEKNDNVKVIESSQMSNASKLEPESGPKAGQEISMNTRGPGVANIPTIIPTRVAPGSARGQIWPGMSGHHTDDQAFNQPEESAIQNFDQPLIIDLSADRFGRTASQQNTEVKTEPMSSEETENTSTNVIGHFVIR